MFCQHCGNSNDNASKFCFSCGKALEASAAPDTPPAGAYVPPPQQPQPGYQAYQTPQPQKTTNTMAIIGLVCAFFMPLVGLVVSIIARKQCIENQEEGQNLATAGIIVSVISMALIALLVIGSIIFAFAVAADPFMWY